MKNIAHSALRLLGFRRSAPKTKFGRYTRVSQRTLGAVGLLYVALLAFPQVLFAHSVTDRGVTIYSRTPLPAETLTRISEINDLVSASELAVSGRNEGIFLCNNPWLFRLFAPLSADAFAASSPVRDHVFVAQADLAGNVARNRKPKHNTRSFSSVAAHEITHGLIWHRLGLIRGVRLAPWVAEGYCDYIARESSFPEAEGLALLRGGGEDPSPAFRYFKYRQMVRYLLEDRRYSFAGLVARAGNPAAVHAETVNALRDANRQ